MKEFDYIIVGAGSAGCVLANRLSADPANRVLLLEAGGHDRYPLMRMPIAIYSLFSDPRFTWGYETEPEPHCNDRRLPIPRGRVLGGTSSINAMVYARGHPADYDEWEAMGLEGWGYESILPYFKRSERNWRGETLHHGGHGELSVSPSSYGDPLYELFAQAAERVGFHRSSDHNGAEPEGISPSDLTIRKGRRCSTARAFLYPARSRPNLTVISGALVERVLIDNQRAIGVAYRKGSETHTVSASAEVILSGGTYNSPQLLMLSGIGPADTLRSLGITPVLDQPEVGQNLEEHVNTTLTTAINQPLSIDPKLRLDRMTASFARWAVTGKGPAASVPLSVTGFIRTQSTSERPDTEIIASPVSPDAHLWFPFLRKPAGHHFSCRIAVLHPHSRGEIKLRSADPAAPPRISWNLFQDPRDLQTLRDGVKAVRSIFSSEPLKGLCGEEVAPGPSHQTETEIEAWLRDYCGTAQHPACTCRMGTDASAVVDARLRVNGVDGLRVVDCSVMPHVVGANTNAPTIMIAEKASDMILGNPPLSKIEMQA